MSQPSRRKLITAGLAGASGLAVAAKLAGDQGLLPPDAKGIYGPGEILTYATHRLVSRHAMAREFAPAQISNPPYVNGPPPKDETFLRHQSEGFANWKLTVDGLVALPAAFSLADLKSHPSRSQITHLACEEGWSYIAEWKGVPLSQVLELAGVKATAKYVVYFSLQGDWWDSVDLDEANHPQTLVAYGLNGGDLPVGNGGPLRMRVPRQLGYKSVKYITRLTVTDSLKGFGKGLGSASPEAGYSWYAGI